MSDFAVHTLDQKRVIITQLTSAEAREMGHPAVVTHRVHYVGYFESGRQIFLARGQRVPDADGRCPRGRVHLWFETKEKWDGFGSSISTAVQQAFKGEPCLTN